MMRPNKRFLRHIIKDTDTHNRNLLAKEAAESRARLKDLERAEERKRRKTNPNARDIRQRQMGDIHAILGGKKRRKEEDDDEAPSGSSSTKHREHHRSLEKVQDLTRHRHEDRKHHGRLTRDEDRHGRTERSQRDERRKSRRSHSSESNSGDERRHHSRRRRDRSASPRRRHRSRSPKERKSRHRHRSPIEDKSSKRRPDVKSDDDSDPLDDLIGPAPPPRYRGRGALGSSGIDRRFSDTYDPRTDVQMDENEGPASGNNWDDAVEAFRDRQKLKQNQEQRLRDAGFADEEIQRASSSKELAEADVRWTKVGEKREWDRGKVDGEDAFEEPHLFSEMDDISDRFG